MSHVFGMSQVFGMSHVFAMSHVLVFLFVNSVACQRYILTPKMSVMSSVYTDLSSRFNLDKFAEWPSEYYSTHGDETYSPLQFYLAEHRDIIGNRNELSTWFDIEEDKTVRLSRTSGDQFVIVEAAQAAAPWHLDRIVKRKLPLNGKYGLNTPGSCHANSDYLIDTYVVDTGIDVTHSQFGGRATWGANFADDVDTDCNSHGTHVAGLIGSRDYGVCVDARLHAVKVLTCEGSGSLSGVIRGIEWAFKQHLTKTKTNGNRTTKSIINMSLGGGYSRAINRAVEACVKRNDNFYIVVAAGNENNDACDTSPASVDGILTVMASDSRDDRAWFSNWGKCANVYAPGVDIISTIPDERYAKYSGTSMASPVAAGVLNHYIDMYPEHNMKQMLSIVDTLATPNVIRSEKDQTPNLLVYLERV